MDNRKLIIDKTSEFIQKAQLIHHNYDYTNTTYEKATIKICVVCPKHGSFKIRARDHLAGKGCPRCAIENKHNNEISQDEFVSRAQKIHNHKYDYSKVNYKNSKTKVTIICPIHGEFKQRPSLHLRGHNCKKCSIESTRNDLNGFIEKATSIHDGRYDYPQSQYQNARTNIVITCPIHGEFKQLVNNHLAGSGCPKCPTTISSFHQDVIDFIGDRTKLKINDRDTIAQEIDIYVPEFKLGIELNGDYWHSWHPHDNKPENKRKHADKHAECNKNNIKLLQITEYEWHNQNTQNIWKSIIDHHLKKTPNIHHARKCNIVIDFSCSKFLKENHLQGNRNACVRIGLAYNEELISVMTFENHKQYGWEIIRYATKQNHLVVGGAGKLFKYFIETHQPHSVLTFANLRYSNGDVYKKLGFKQINKTEPGYIYLKRGVILSRYKCQKHKLQKWLPIFDNNKSECENMFINGYRRLYDAGNLKFLWTR